MRKIRTSFSRDRSRTSVADTTHPVFKLDSYHFGAAVNGFASRKEWDEIIDLLTPRLRLHDDQHWLHFQLAAACFEKGDNIACSEYLLKASDRTDSCPFVLWEWARAYYRYEWYSAAILDCEWIIEGGAADVLHDTCCENRAAAESLVNDCHYLLAAIYINLNKYDLAKSSMHRYQQGIEKRIRSRFGYAKAMIPFEVMYRAGEIIDLRDFYAPPAFVVDEKGE